MSEKPVKFRGLFTADFHLRSRVPPSRKSFLSDFVVKWEEICQLVEDLDINVICILGDLFNPLVSSGTAHGLVSWITGQFQKAQCDILVLPGNHDIRLDNDLKHLLGRPLGVLVASETVTLVDSSGVKIKGVRICGSPCPMMIDTDIKNYMMPVNEPGIMLTHGNLVFPGHQTWSTLYTKVEELDQMNFSQIVHLNGHLHAQQALYKGRICKYGSPGALMRDFDSVGGLNQVVKVIIVEIDMDNNATLIMKQLKSVKPFAEVFRVEEIKCIKEKEAAVADFVQMLCEEVKRTSLGDDLFEAVSKLKLSSELELMVKDFLTQAVSQEG